MAVEDDTGTAETLIPERDREEKRPAVGTILAGRYELKAILGAGGMGTVYAAHDRELDEQVALKILKGGLAASPEALDRFRREVKLARRVTHVNVARTFELGEHEGLRFLTMELVDGEPLSRRIARGPMPPEEAAPIAISIGEGLSAAHTAGVIHRDIKPDNVLIGRDGRVVISDFGIARSAGPGAIDPMSRALLGTPAYMAPEQISGGEITSLVDVYAFGVVLFKMLVGRLPFSGQTPIEGAYARLVEPPPDARSFVDIPREVAEVIHRAMAISPADRPKSAKEIGAVFARLIGGSKQAHSAFGPPADIGLGQSTKKLGHATLMERGFPSPTPAIDTQLPSIAVIPFRNAGPPEDDYLALGLAEDLTDSLSGLRGLRVLSAGASSRFKAPERDAVEVGKELRVRYVVDGSIKRGGEALRLVTRLVDVRDGYQLTSHRFDGTAAEMFRFQEQAAGAMAKALSVESAGVGPQREAPDDPIALDLYLRARHAYHRVDPEGVGRSVSLFREALERAPEHPLISAGLAMAEVRAWFLHPGDPPPELPARVLKGAEESVLRAPHLGESHLALGLARFHNGDSTGAAHSFRAAIARSPSLAEAHDTLGRMLVETGRVQDGLRRLRVAMGLDSSLTTPLLELVRALALFGEWDRVMPLLAQLERDELELPHLFAVRVLVWRDDRAALERLDPHWRSSSDARTRLMLDRYFGRATNQEVYLFLDANVPGAGGSARRRALHLQMKAEYAALYGEPRVALEALDGADRSGFIDLLWMERFPPLEPLRNDREFLRIQDSVRRRADAIADAVWG
jgi:serine/threonine-protein kinase